MEQDALLRRAARFIAGGGVVAFPTETVYGLGADAFNADAVRRVYAVKNRPRDNPLILHVNTPGEAEALVEITEQARALMDAFWPGPLTLVLKKRAALPPWLGGHPDCAAELETAAVRAPAHPIARRLIEYAARPIAAPSANKSGAPSPTTAAHVYADLPGGADMILDGGAARCGLESTVLDMSGESPAILRPGAVTPEMLSGALKSKLFSPCIEYTSEHKTYGGCEHLTVPAPRSPGMKYRHYAPEAPVTLVTGETPSGTAARIIELTARALDGAPERTIGILATEQTIKYYIKHFNERLSADPQNAPLPRGARVAALTAGDRGSPESVARNLYACLRRFDELKVDEIFAESFAETGVGLAVMNRLVKAAGGRVI